MLSAELTTMLSQLNIHDVSECYDVLKHRRRRLDDIMMKVLKKKVANNDSYLKQKLVKSDSNNAVKVWLEDKGKRIDCKITEIKRSRIIVRPLDGGRGWNCFPSSLTLIESPIISNEDMTKLNGAIEEAAHKIVNQNKSTFNPATGDFE